ncbi:hypothetical protein DFH27DRAFT_468061, partial [Peziza echinospora]
MIYMQHALVYMEYQNTVLNGDVGRIEKVLEMWTIMFQGSNLTNYPMEMMHLITCLRKVWSPEF